MKKDLESSNSKLQDNSQNLNKFIDQSNKIDVLERENRTLLAELDFMKWSFELNEKKFKSRNWQFCLNKKKSGRKSSFSGGTQITSG